MSLGRQFKDSTVFTTGVLLMLAFVSDGLCQSEPEQGDEPQSSDTPEEITVYGQKTLAVLRANFYRAEEDFLALFSSLNSNDEFDFECGFEVHLGSPRRVHVCEPKYEKRYKSDVATAFMYGEDSTYLLTWRRKKEKLMWIEMAELVLKHPQMQDAMNQLATAKLDYDSKRKE